MGFVKRILFIILAVVAVGVIQSAPAKAYSNENMIDNAVFDNKDAMNEAQIRAFIQARPNTCLTRVGAGFGGGNIFDEPINYWDYGPNKVDAARVIYKAAQYNEINPQVLIATLQKEQSLFSDNDCLDNDGFDRLNKVMGTGCFEGNRDANGNLICPDPNYAGFHRQIMKGAWQLAFDRHRAEGNTAWGGNDLVNYYGRMTEGNRRRCGNCTLIYYDGYSVIDGVSTRMGNGATAALYNYTPHRNQSFSYWFENFFGAGSTSSLNCYPASLVPLRSGISFRKIRRNVDSALAVLYEGSSTSCVESHAWNTGMQSWGSHVVANQPSVNPDNTTIMMADLTGTGLDYPVAINFRNTGSGRVEFHVWNYDMRSWVTNVVSNLPEIDPTVFSLQFGNLYGKDEPVLVGVGGTTTGMVELHYWNSGLQSWRAHSATNLPVANADNYRFRYADINGDGRDEMVVVGVNNTSTGKVEFHVWNPGEQSWKGHYVSNLVTTDLVGSDILFADSDGDSVDEAVLVKTANTASGRIEFHTWNPGYYSWRSHVASNQPTF